MDKLLEIRRAKSAAEHSLLEIEGVTGVGVGEKLVKGQRIGMMSIRVYVEKKLPKSSLSKAQLIPDSINGIPTDVIERKFVLHPAAVALDDLRLRVDAGTYDPLTGGISVGPCRAIGGFVFVGTLGLVVEDNATGDPMMLSNFHVMCIDSGWSVGDTMAQPARPDGGSCPAGIVGELTRASIGGQVDAAVARITNRNHDCRITEIGAVTGTALPVDSEPVRKRGRTTELTHGFVDDVSLTVSVPYDPSIGTVTLTNQIGIEVDASQSTQFGTNGDSGSVVVNAAGEVIGLYFAGTEDGSFGVANPIAAVFSALDVRLCTPTVATSPWLDAGPTSPWLDAGPTQPWLDAGPTSPWRDAGPTAFWLDQGGGPTIKRVDDVKDPSGFDTMMETIQESIDTFQEVGGTLQEMGGTLQEAGGFDPRDPGFANPPGGFRGGGAAPFAMATPHHAAGAQRFEAAAGGGGRSDLDQHIEQVRGYLQALEAQRRRG